ncbi:HNH endonuclease [Mesorhizobium sp. M0189]|uniref:HNH endonuclease n=1 Tax=Mesorhizobium sp. M0189 TaxID=2956909 RepID=UPI0033356F57
MDGIGITENGYAYQLVESHPMKKSGRVAVHRKVLYDEIGPGPHRCRWCGHKVTWGGTRIGSLVVDHVDGDKLNNEIDNLVPSCTPCNTARAYFMNWASRHADDPFLLMLFAGAIEGEGVVRNVKRHPQFSCDSV